MTNHDLMLLAKGHQLLKQLQRCIGTSRHIRVIYPHQLHPAQVSLLQSLKVRLPSLLLQQVILHHLCPQQLRYGSVSGITGIGDQHSISEVQEGHRDMQDPLLGAYQRQYLSRRQGDVIETLVPISICFSQLRDSRIWLIGMHIRLACSIAEHLNCLLRRHPIGCSYRQTDHVFTFGIHTGHFSQFHREIVFFY